MSKVTNNSQVGSAVSSNSPLLGSVFFFIFSTPISLTSNTGKETEPLVSHPSEQVDFEKDFCITHKQVSYIIVKAPESWKLQAR